MTAPATPDSARTDGPRLEPSTALVTRRARWAAPIERWVDVRLLVVGFAVTAVRFAFAADRRVFHVVADEPGQLAMARWLSGGTRWNMFDHSTWRPGYSVVIAPVFWLADTGEGAVRGALTVNAVLAGISAVVLARLLARWTRTWDAPVGPLTCCAVAVAVAVAPAAIVASAYTWAEALVTCTFLVTLWWTQRFVDTGRLAHALVATAWAAAAMTAHGRSLALLPTVIAVAAFLLVRRGRWLAAGAVTGTGAILGLASLAFTDWVQGAVWDDPNQINTPASVIERLDAPVALVESFIGQSWYQLVASLGMVGVGAAIVLGSVWRPRDRLDRPAALVLIVLTAPLVMTSVTFMAGRHRADQLVYGRYVDAVVWPLAAIGAAAAIRFLARRHGTAEHRRDVGRVAIPAVALVVAAFGLVVAWRHGDQLAGDVGLRMMVPGLLPYIGSHDGVPVLRITALVTLVLLAVVAVPRVSRGVGRRGAVAGAVAAAAVLTFAGVRVHDAQALVLNGWAIGDQVARVDEIVPDGERIGVVMVPDGQHPRESYTVQRQHYQVYQLYLPDRELVWERHPGSYTSEFVFAPAGNPELRRMGATVRWGDPTARIALWEVPPDAEPAAGTRLPSRR